MFLSRLLSLVAVGALLVGCANEPVSTQTLSPARERTAIVFDRDFLYTHQAESAPVRRFTGIFAGKYQAELEDDKGVFFRGTGLCVQWADEPGKEQYLANGGIWIAKSGDTPQFQIYWYRGTEVARSQATGAIRPMGITPVDATTATVSSSQIIMNSQPAASPIVAGVGAAIGIGIAQAIVESERGKIKFPRDHPPASVRLSNFRKVVD